MTNVLFALTGVDYWTFKDGTKHPCGYWPEEFVTPHKIFTAAGFDVTLATPGGVRPVPDAAGYSPEMNGGSAEAGQALADYIEAAKSEIDQVVNLDEVDVADFDLVFIPGGHGPMEDLAVSEPFGTLLNDFYRAQKPIAAVCHGPAGLLSAKNADGSWLFDGYRLTAFTNTEETQAGFADSAEWLLEDRLRENGANVDPGEPWGSHVVVDRNLYTGQNPASSEALAEKLVGVLKA
jgi:putative intracellular protease/amidase